MKRNFTISCNTQNLSEIRDFSRTCLAELNISDAEANQIVLAVDEVCANRIIHSNNCDDTKDIQISFVVDKDDVVVEIMDNGAEYKFETYKKPDVNELIRERQKGGVGLMLVQEIMDKVEFVREAHSNICRLQKHLHKS